MNEWYQTIKSFIDLLGMKHGSRAVLIHRPYA